MSVTTHVTVALPMGNKNPRVRAESYCPQETETLGLSSENEIANVTLTVGTPLVGETVMSGGQTMVGCIVSMVIVIGGQRVSA